MTLTVRQARLKPEYADLYPWLTAGIWEVAANVAEKRLLLLTRQPPPPAPAGRRPLPDEHFEFRGGFPRRVARHGEQTSPRFGPAQSPDSP
ncbi:MAG: hypothetical protein ACR2HK_04995 [Gemmatimonadales bacterium]